MQDGVSSYHRYLQGETQALEELVSLYSGALVRFASCYVKDPFAAEDIAEDSFVALIVRRKHFADEAHLKAYLFKIARNKCLDHLRYETRTVPLVSLFGYSADAPANAEPEGDGEVVQKCLKELPAQYRDVLWLTYYEGFKPNELTSVLRQSKKQVYNLLARAKAALKERLLKEGIFDENL